MNRALGLLLLFLAAAAPAKGYAATLHAIIVADTFDKTLGRQAARSALQLDQLLLVIALNADLELNKRYFSGRTLSLASFLEAVDEMEVNDDDTILFYFLGHGYRYRLNDSETPWPYLHFSADNSGANQYEIAKILEQKRPRLLLSFADACNSLIEDNVEKDSLAAAGRSLINESSVEANYYKLFNESKGMIIAAAAEPGSYSWYNNKGGVFTQELVKQLLVEVKKGKGAASWENLLDRIDCALTKQQQIQYTIINDSEEQ